MRFDLIRLVLTPRAQLDLWGSIHPGQKMPSREDWLRSIFEERIEFLNYGVEYHFAPAGSSGTELIIGMIGRQRTIKENEPPEKGLTQTARETWKAIPIVIDPRHHEDGQKVAAGYSDDVGKPTSFMAALTRTLNERLSEPYIIEANGIIDPETFFGFVRQNEGKITKVTFDLFAPNMFGIRSDLDREMKELRDNERSQRTKLSLENRSGLNLNTERVRQTAEYTADGGGNITARTIENKSFNSQDNIKSVKVDGVEDIRQETLTRFQAIMKIVFKL